MEVKRFSVKRESWIHIKEKSQILEKKETVQILSEIDNQSYSSLYKMIIKFNDMTKIQLTFRLKKKTTVIWSVFRMNLEFFLYSEWSKFAKEVLQIFGPRFVLPVFVPIIVLNIKLFAKKKETFFKNLVSRYFLTGPTLPVFQTIRWECYVRAHWYMHKHGSGRATTSCTGPFFSIMSDF